MEPLFLTWRHLFLIVSSKWSPYYWLEGIFSCVLEMESLILTWRHLLLCSWGGAPITDLKASCIVFLRWSPHYWHEGVFCCVLEVETLLLIRRLCSSSSLKSCMAQHFQLCSHPNAKCRSTTLAKWNLQRPTLKALDAWPLNKVPCYL